jgi:prepilin-type processing-associated H-X9-DG protein
MTTETANRPWNPLAVLTVVLGVLVLTPWTWVLAPVPLILGFLAVRAINASEGQQQGIRLAWAGLFLGAIGCVLMVVGIVSLILVSLQPSASRMADANHLRQIGIALKLYHDLNKEHFPPAVSQLSSLPPEQRLSWLVLQLPYLEERKDGRGKYSDLAASLALDQGFAAPVNAGVREPLRVFQSPDAPPNPPVPDFTSYVGITGVGGESATVPAEDPRAGFFGYSRLIGRTDLKAGLAYTLTVSETTQGGSWGQGGPATAVDIPVQEDDLIGRGRPFGGLHPDGFHLLFADGHTSFNNQKFPPQLLRELARINRPSE